VVAPESQTPPVIWTIGHSSRPLAAFVGLLQAERIEGVADVRRYPGSRAHPHFNPEPLASGLGEAGIAYLPFPDLGGRRPPAPDSRNTAWRHAAFRGFADYMDTPAFSTALDRLLTAARGQRVAVMCSEAVWWRCHRSLIADALKAAGVQVLHIMDGRKTKEHPYTSAARLVDGRLCYSSPDVS